MNRIKLGPLAMLRLEDEMSSMDEGFQAASALSPIDNWTTGEFSWFVPMHYEPGYAYPLIVWLHGDGADCNQLQRYIPDVSMRNYVAVAPQSGFSPGSPVSWPNCEESIDAAYESVMAAIDGASLKYNIDFNRIFIVGVGTGGSMALRLAFERPDVFSGVVSLDGPIQTNDVPLGQWEQCRNVPVLLSAFRRSDFSEADLCENLRLLHVGGFNTTVRQYPGSLNLSEKVLSDMNRWIMEQIDSSIL